MAVALQARYYFRLAVLSFHEAIRGLRPESSWIAKYQGSKSVCAGYCHTAYLHFTVLYCFSKLSKHRAKLKPFFSRCSRRSWRTFALSERNDPAWWAILTHTISQAWGRAQTIHLPAASKGAFGPLLPHANECWLPLRGSQHSLA